jgi:hypothetical protein
MYPVNTPNIYNQPKPGERFFLKEGRYFWYSSIMKTYNKTQQAAWQKEMEEKTKQDPQTTDDNIN